jgi:hypothetical protein
VPGAPVSAPLSRSGDAAKDLVQATCLGGIKRAEQRAPGTQLVVLGPSVDLTEWSSRAPDKKGRSGMVDVERVLISEEASTVENEYSRRGRVQCI